MKINKTLADFGAYGAALQRMGVDENTLYSKEDQDAVGIVIDNSVNSLEEAEIVRDYYIAQFRAAIEKLVKEHATV